MPVTINGTTGIVNPDGSASTPSLAGTDSNTGVFFPAADTVAIATGGTERVRTDSSGNVGIGVTPSAWFSTFRALQFGANGSSVFGRSENNTAAIASNAFINSSGNFTYINSSTASYYQQLNGQHQFYNAPSGTAGNAISFTQAMTLDASGRLLTPNQPAFRAVRTSSFTVTGGTSQEIVYNSAIFDINNNYNNSNGRFTAPVAGTYYFTATIQPTSSGSNNTLQFYVNGSAVGYTAVAWTPQPARGDLLISVVLRLNASDYVSAYTSASSTTTYDNNGLFSGFLVG